MSENDYIAEYIKEKYPSLLGIEFGLWKFAKQIIDTLKLRGRNQYSKEEECAEMAK